jgi:hypothetical protein
MATKGTDTSFLLRVLKRNFEDLVNSSVDLLFGGSEFDAASTTIHCNSPRIAMSEGNTQSEGQIISQPSAVFL